MNVIEFRDVWEMYRIKFIIDGKASRDNFWALKNITFNVEKGDILGIIGENGAGKSTVLKLIAGMLKPDRGEVRVQGGVSGLLELGAGFQPELTGKENIYLSAGLFGLTQKQIEEKYEDIVNFASIGKFIHAQVKAYSQGMFVRLAFSVAIHMDPDILLIDDILSVGDEYFQKKCIKKIFELKEQKKTIVFVTHDMNMLKRICKRAIFLKEGRIVKDSSADKVMPLYTQMAGVREGVGFLEKKPLNLVFNNGRFFLNRQDSLITSNSGAYTAFRIADKWYSSLQANWEVEREGENKITARGKFYQLALTQVWSLELTDNYEIKWNIEMESREPLKIGEGCVNILLNDKYSRWFTLSEKGGFPLIDENSRDWQELSNDNAFRKCVGVEAVNSGDIKLPCLFFEQFNHEPASYGRVLNTDYFTNSRVLQYKAINLERCPSARAGCFIYFSGRIIIGAPNTNNYLEKLRDAFTLSNGKLKLAVEKGRGILSYNNINLTKAVHIGSSFYANGRWYNSHSARWQVKKDGDSKLIAKGAWQGLAIARIWEIEMNSESCFSWKVNMEVYEEVNIEEQRLQFMCSKEYKRWFSDYGAGEFPEQFLENEVDTLQRCIPDGSIALLSEDNRLPAISLGFSGGKNSFAKIFNADFHYKARILQIGKVEPEADIKFLPGKYSCFAIEANLNKGAREDTRNSSNMLSAKDLNFSFDKGRGRIFWKEVELTKKLGLYTSVRSEGRWHDSYSKAIWKIKEKNGKTIKAVGKWLRLPIVQHWEIGLKEDNAFDIIMTMKVNKEIEVDRLQANIMLGEKYSGWIADKGKGFFPEFKADINDDWDCVQPSERNSRYIGAEEKPEGNGRLPSILFSLQTVNPDWRLNIVNSDIYHRGRVLQYLNAGQKAIKPGEYSYFTGKIVIGEY